MPSHSRRDTHGSAHGGGELVGREPAQHRHHSVVPAYWVKAQGPRGKPNPGDGQPAAANVTDNDAAASHTVELAQQDDPIIAAKVVQQLRAQYDVEGAVGKGQVSRIRAQHGRSASVSGERERLTRIQAHRADCDSVPRSVCAYARGDIAETSTYVEERERRARNEEEIA